MHDHGFCKMLLREGMKAASPDVRKLFWMENIGVTKSGKQFAVEFVKSLNGKREVIWVKAECRTEAKFKALDQLMTRVLPPGELAPCVICGEPGCKATCLE